MELPIDHFRLLGVSPAADAQGVLRTLQLRLDRPPDDGFTQETLQIRAELLRASADLLTDSDRRSAYEAELTALETSGAHLGPGLEVAPSKEVAGLLLLLEAGQGAEAFEVARRNLQPPQAPALGSSREADLILLAALACQASAAEYRKERRYEASAQTLQLGLQLLQRTGQLPASRQAIDRSLATLLPYRVLDLLSRDLAATSERSEGLQLLEQLVQRRGGLDGSGDPDFSAEEFQVFFKQIRQFLTVQEQVDLFSHWAVQSSPTAGFLASYALTASGFSQRKPERIAAARERLSASGQPGLEAYQACLSLLLGQIDAAKLQFDQGASEELRLWAAEQGPDPLAGLCAYCQDWLDREVLPGYRDIEIEADLEAWFADRDVQLFVERQDRLEARASVTAPGTPAGGALEGQSLGSGFSQDWPAPAPPLPDRATPYASSAGSLAEAEEAYEEDGLEWPRWEWPQWEWPQWQVPRWELPQRAAEALQGLRWNPADWPLSRWGKPAALTLLALGVAGGGLLVIRSRWGQPDPAAITSPPPPAPPKPPLKPSAGGPQPLAAKPEPAGADLLQSNEPSDAELQALLERWLAAKASVLAGKEAPQPLENLARPYLVGQLQRQRREEASRGESQRIETTVRQLTVTSRTPQRIEAEVELTYSDELRDREGKLLERTPEGSRSNRYVFGRDGATWKLAAFRPLA